MEWWIWFAWWILEFIIKKHETLVENPPVQICSYKIKSRIVFKVKTGYKLELLSSETMKLLESRNKDVDQDKDREDAPKTRIFWSCFSTL